MTRMRDKVSKLGRLVSGTHHSRREKGKRGTTGILPIGMKMIINLFCDGLADASDPIELAETGARNRSRRAEMVQERLLSPRPDPGNLVKRRASERFCPLGAVSADGKAVRLVSQALQEIEDGIPRVERKRRPAGKEEALAPGVAVGSLGDRRDRHVVDAELGKHALRNVELPLAAIDQHEIGPAAPIAFGILFQRPREPTLQHLAHHRVVVTASKAGVLAI